MRRSCLSLVFACALGAASSGCALYDGPPEGHIEGAENGALSDPEAPIILKFSEPILPETLKLKIVRFETDIEGNFADEVDPEAELDPFFSYEPPGFAHGGVAEMINDDRAVSMTPALPLPIGPKLAILIEAGLSDRNGNVTKVRRRILFGYKFDLHCEDPTTFPTGDYFLIVEVEKPISVQVQLWSRFEVDPETGAVRGQNTNADRNADPNRCPMPCSSTEVCRLFPAPKCVAPSEKAGTVDEHLDFVPNNVPPTGFTFATDGCAVDQPDGSVIFATAPADVIVQQPAVTLRNVRLTAQFIKDASGIFRGTGSLTADTVYIGPVASDEGEGSLTGRFVLPGEAPPGIPAPPPPE